MDVKRSRPPPIVDAEQGEVKTGGWLKRIVASKLLLRKDWQSRGLMMFWVELMGWKMLEGRTKFGPNFRRRRSLCGEEIQSTMAIEASAR